MRTKLASAIGSAFRLFGATGQPKRQSPGHRGVASPQRPIGVLADGGQWHLVERRCVNRANGQIETQLLFAPK
jgi:hypothetical protein